MRRIAAAIIAFIVIAALVGIPSWTAIAQNSGTSYTVQPGDTLFSIGQRFGVTPDEIAQANNIGVDDTIFVGQVLVIPPPDGSSAGSSTPLPPTATATVVQQPTYLIVTTTPVPQGVAPTPLPPAVVVTAGPSSVPAVEAAAPAGNYTVQPGDTLFHIATMFNTTTDVLMQMNGITNGNMITVGQTLRVPGGANAGAPTAVQLGSVAPTALPPGILPPTPMITPQPTIQNSAPAVGFGIGVDANVTADNLSKVNDEVKDLGVTWIRMIVPWKQFETTKGSIDFTALDTEVNTLNGTGIEILFTVTDAPDWARGVTTENGPPVDYNDYANFVSALAARYKGKVQAYEIWSEPNIRREWNGIPLSAASYVALLQMAYAAIKKVDPTIIVVSAGLAPTGFNDGTNAISDRIYLKQEYTAGLAGSSDAIGAHPDGYANPPDSTCCGASAGVTGWFNDPSFYFLTTLKDYRAIMTQNNDSGSLIWVTQVGWGASEGVAPNAQSVDPNLGYVLLNTQAKQEQYLPRAFELGRTLGYIGPMLVYNLNACQTESNPPISQDVTACYYSLIDGSGNPRPAYQAVKAARK